MFELTFAEKMLLMKLIEAESIKNDFFLSSDLRSAYRKMKDATEKEAYGK